MANNLQFVNPMQSFNEGLQTGRQNRFNALAGQAVAATPEQRAGLISEAAQADPIKAVALNKVLGEQDSSDEERRNKALVNMARFYVAAPPQAKEQVRSQLAPSLAKFGIDAANVSPDEFDKTAQALVEAWTPASQVPSGQREFEAMTKGLSAEDRLRAQRIKVGLDPRAVSGSSKTFMVKGRDGSERPGIFDPATQEYKVFDGGAWRSIGADEAAQAVPTSALPSTSAAPKPSVEELLRQATRMANEGGPGKNQAAAQTWLNQQVEANGYRPAAPTPADLAVGRPAEAEAGAVQNAKNASDLAYLPQSERVKADAAVDQATRTAAGKAAVEANAKDTEEASRRQKDANDTLSLLDEAERILPQATGSRGGQALDDAAAMVGQSTTGAQATAQLQTIAGQITSKMPRMQGPQSDSDVVLYKQMAGDLANPDRPVETRLAALRVIRRLQQKYASPQASSSPAGASAPAGKDFSHLW